MTLLNEMNITLLLSLDQMLNKLVSSNRLASRRETIEGLFDGSSDARGSVILRVSSYPF